MTKKVARPVVSLDRDGQQSLFGDAETPPASMPAPRRRPAQFNHPDPRQLRVGHDTLYAHLKQVGERDALVVRDVLEGLDWTVFEAHYSAEGRRAYHPALMAGIVLYGLMRGVSSLRDLERFARVDLGCCGALGSGSGGMRTCWPACRRVTAML